MERVHKKTMTDIRKKPAKSSAVFSTTSRAIYRDNISLTSRSGQKNQDSSVVATTSRVNMLDKTNVPEKNLSSGSPNFKKKFLKFTKHIMFIGVLGLIGWFASSLWYHGQIQITIKKQIGSIDENFTAVPRSLFTGSEKTLPYYTYISEFESQIDNITSPTVFESLHSKLPPDAITDVSFVFIIPPKDERGTRLGIIFFKKDDIETYLNTFVLDKTYKNILQSISHTQITTAVPVDYQLIQGNFPVHLISDFRASGSVDIKTVGLRVVGLDRFTCKEILQSIPEITVDRCHIIPFWYHKMPQNPLFIKIKDKNP